MLKLKIKKLHPEAIIPTRTYRTDAGIDLYSIEDVTIPSGHQREVRTGVALEIPEGYHVQLHTRSSFGKKGLRCHLGIFDSGYRNEVTIWVVNTQQYNENDKGGLIPLTSYEIKKGDKICQMILLPVPEVEIIEVDELSESERGTKGHGSSGR